MSMRPGKVDVKTELACGPEVGKIGAMLARPATALAVLVACLQASGAARAKEHTAGCTLLPPLIERLRTTMVLASVHRARGSSLAAYQVMRINAAALMNDPDARSCGAFTQTLSRALARASATKTAADASLELDLGYTGALALALLGQLPGGSLSAKQLDVPESAVYSEDCPDLLAIVRKLEASAPALEGRAAAVLADLKQRPRCLKVRELLDTRPERLAAAVDALLLDEQQASPSATNPIARCPELPLVLERLAGAINLGAPLYNKGDHDGCRQLYEKTARDLLGPVIPAGRCPVVRRELEGALAEAARSNTVGDAAWALRRGFDRIAGSLRPGDESAPPN
jgi:hypothetical protein